MLTVPDTLGADDLLAEMRRRGAREALVIDEHGGTAGLVTFESLMERIVGEIPGEMGAQTRTVVRQDGSADIDGLALVSDINEQFGLHIDESTYTTIGGYVLGRLGRRPRVGDIIDVEGRKMRVDAIDGIAGREGVAVEGETAADTGARALNEITERGVEELDARGWVPGASGQHLVAATHSPDCRQARC